MPEMVEGPSAMAAAITDEIEHFFNVYKQLEPGKFANTRGFEGRAVAEAEIAESQERAKGTSFA